MSPLKRAKFKFMLRGRWRPCWKISTFNARKIFETVSCHKSIYNSVIIVNIRIKRIRVVEICHNYAGKQHIKYVCLIKLIYIITEIVQVKKKITRINPGNVRKDMLLKLTRNNTQKFVRKLENSKSVN